MKNIFFGLVMGATTLAACNSSNNKVAENRNANKDTAPVKAQVGTSTATRATVAEVKDTSAIKEIVATYLQLKNAFITDNSNDAATAGTLLQTAFKNFGKIALTVPQKKLFEEVADDASEHAAHIGKNGGNIVHQREHFIMLSKDMADLIKAFGNGGQTLYKDFCPMANDGKGAIWISETKDIKNPYLGKAMPTCGTMKEEIK